MYLLMVFMPKVATKAATSKTSGPMDTLIYEREKLQKQEEKKKKKKDDIAIIL